MFDANSLSANTLSLGSITANEHMDVPAALLPRQPFGTAALVSPVIIISTKLRCMRHLSAAINAASV
jgi:hypothetical protein